MTIQRGQISFSAFATTCQSKEKREPPTTRNLAGKFEVAALVVLPATQDDLVRPAFDGDTET